MIIHLFIKHIHISLEINILFHIFGVFFNKSEAILEHFSNENTLKMEHFSNVNASKMEHFSNGDASKMEHFSNENASKMEHFSTGDDLEESCGLCSALVVVRATSRIQMEYSYLSRSNSRWHSSLPLGCTE